MESRAHILLVDDMNDLVEYTSRRLRSRGMEVSVALSGEEALQVIRSGTIDVVILDILMPGMDGFETLRELKRVASEVPVVILTGQATEAAAVEGKALGAFEHLLKPVEFSVLLSAIDRACGARGETRRVEAQGEKAK